LNSDQIIPLMWNMFET